MDSQDWKAVYAMIRSANKRIPGPARKPEYSDVLIVAMYLWSVWHDRPLNWACKRSSYGREFRPQRLPSYSRFSRRIRTPRCGRILLKVHQLLSRPEEPSSVSFIDGRVLMVGRHSKDREATSGKVGRQFARGYRLHAWATEDGRIPMWCVTSLNVGEQTVAREMLRYGSSSNLVLADAGYDSGDLYDQFEEHGVELYTAMHMKNAGQGHRPQSAARMRAIRAWNGILKYVYRQRNAIERIFGRMVSTAGGLNHLPAWVRTLERVTRWVVRKLILYHARLCPQWAVK